MFARPVSFIGRDPPKHMAGAGDGRDCYHAGMTVVVGIYAAGVVLGLLMADARLPVRFTLALLWPLGPLALAATMLLLIVVACVAFPPVGVIIALGGAAGLYWALA
jgi:hypothetical protein